MEPNQPTNRSSFFDSLPGDSVGQTDVPMDGGSRIPVPGRSGNRLFDSLPGVQLDDNIVNRQEIIS